MEALGRLPPASGISVMQSINVAVLKPLFFAAFFGTAALSILLAIAAFVGWSGPAAIYLVAGSLLYLVGTILVTMVFNVPLKQAESAACTSVWGVPERLDGVEPCANGVVACGGGIIHHGVGRSGGLSRSETLLGDSR
jgi:hypothetical protein